MDSKRTASSTDLKPVERFLKRYEPLTSRDSSARRPDAREQIIEEQIEEYKKKREKVLGNQSAKAFTLNETQKEVEEKIWATSSPIKMEKEIIVSIKEDEEKVKEEVEESEKVNESQEKINDNMKEDILKLSREKLKWEETKQKKESLQNQEPDETYIEGNLEKLIRILGEKEKNLQVTFV